MILRVTLVLCISPLVLYLGVFSTYYGRALVHLLSCHHHGYYLNRTTGYISRFLLDKLTIFITNIHAFVLILPFILLYFAAIIFFYFMQNIVSIVISYYYIYFVLDCTPPVLYTFWTVRHILLLMCSCILFSSACSFP